MCLYLSHEARWWAVGAWGVVLSRAGRRSADNGRPRYRGLRFGLAGRTDAGRHHAVGCRGACADRHRSDERRPHDALLPRGRELPRDRVLPRAGIPYLGDVPAPSAGSRVDEGRPVAAPRRRRDRLPERRPVLASHREAAVVLEARRAKLARDRPEASWRHGQGPVAFLLLLPLGGELRRRRRCPADTWDPFAAADRERGSLAFDCPAGRQPRARLLPLRRRVHGVGSYRRKDAKGGGQGSYPWVLDETGGMWGRGHGAELPPDAATTRDFRGASPFMGFSGLSCPTGGNCTAVGGYVDRHGDYQGLILAERDGRWLPGIRAPLPANAVSNNDPNELQNPLVAVSCAAPDDCGAVGWFVTDQSGIRHGLLLSERHGRWQASEIALSKGASGGVGLSSIVCPSPGNCVATGYAASDEQTPSGHATYGVILAERGGSWGRGFTAATPQDAAGGKNSRVFLGPLSCPSARSCTVLGSYVARADQSSSDPPSKG